LPKRSPVRTLLTNFNNGLENNLIFKRIGKRLNSYKAKGIPKFLCRICEQTMSLSIYMVVFFSKARPIQSYVKQEHIV